MKCMRIEITNDPRAPHKCMNRARYYWLDLNDPEPIFIRLCADHANYHNHRSSVTGPLS